jgi:hypothetical protein
MEKGMGRIMEKDSYAQPKPVSQELVRFNFN